MVHAVTMRLSVVCGVTFSGVIWLWLVGPIPVVRVTTVTSEIVPFWYSLSAFPVLGFLLADVMGLAISEKRLGLAAEALAMALLVTIVSQARLSLHLPLSGHALLFGYVLVRRVLVPFPSRLSRTVELVVTAILLAVVGFVKVAWWSDAITPAVGIAVGVVLAGLSRACWCGRG